MPCTGDVLFIENLCCTAEFQPFLCCFVVVFFIVFTFINFFSRYDHVKLGLFYLNLHSSISLFFPFHS